MSERDMSWDDFEKRLIESGWTKKAARAERLAQEFGEAGDCDGDLNFD